MPVGTTEKKTFLHITYGKLRMRTTEGDPQAEARETKDGKTVYERVYTYVEGRLTGIYYKEDEKFGNSFEVTVDDGKEKFQVSFPEGDNYFIDFFSKLSNADLTKWIKIAPYDFTDTSGKRRKGITLMQDNLKIENYFNVKEDDKYVYKNGFPEPENPKKMDKDDWKMYFIKVNKFLRNFIKEKLIPKIQDKNFEVITQSIEEVPEVPETEINNDLPF